MLDSMGIMICQIVWYQYYRGHISCGTKLTGIAIMARQSIDSYANYFCRTISKLNRPNFKQKFIEKSMLKVSRWSYCREQDFGRILVLVPEFSTFSNRRSEMRSINYEKQFLGDFNELYDEISNLCTFLAFWIFGRVIRNTPVVKLLPLKTLELLVL